jgi:hypothetical protein
MLPPKSEEMLRPFFFGAQIGYNRGMNSFIIDEASQKQKIELLIFWGGLGLLLLAGLLLRGWLLDNFPLTPDEGIHLVWLRLLAAGYRPYTEIYITYPPLYPLTLAAVWNLWPGEAAQRWFSVGLTLFGAVGIALLARQVAGTVAGLVAAGLTLFSPPLVEPSRAILGEFHAIAWSVWAVWLALRYREAAEPGQARIFLFLSGLALAASLLTKLLSPFIAPLLLLLILNRHRWQVKPLLADVWLWGGALLLPTVALMMVFNVGPLLEQVVSQRLGARAAATAAEDFWPPRYERGAMFVAEDTALVVGGLAGLVVMGLRRPQGGWLLPAWLALALAMLALHNPIRYKHFLILIPPLAILGSLAVAWWLENLRLALKPNRYAKVYALAGLMFWVWFGLWRVPAALELWQAKANEPQPPPDEVEALAFIAEVTAPDDCLISDDAQLLYWSGRMTPPELAELSHNRLEAGALTLEELTTLSDQYDCQLVAAVSNRLPKHLPAYMEWVKEKYLGRYHYGEDDLFFAKRDTVPQPATPLWADFAGEIIFHGYSLPDAPFAPGQRFPLKLIWQAQTAPAHDYAIFVQLRDERHITLVSADHQPYRGLLPTSSWPARAVIQEVVWLELPPNILPGTYQIYVGLYRPNNLERLPVLNDRSGENALVVGPIKIQ